MLMCFYGPKNSFILNIYKILHPLQTCARGGRPSRPPLATCLLSRLFELIRFLSDREVIYQFTNVSQVRKKNYFAKSTTNLDSSENLVFRSKNLKGGQNHPKTGHLGPIFWWNLWKPDISVHFLDETNVGNLTALTHSKTGQGFGLLMNFLPLP